MRVNITSKNDNPLLARQEIEFEVKETSTTPSRKELRQQVAALVNAEEKKLIVDVVRQRYGSTETSGSARVYMEEKDLKATETKKMLVRNFGKESVEKKKPGKGQVTAQGQAAAAGQGQAAPAGEKK